MEKNFTLNGNGADSNSTVNNTFNASARSAASTHSATRIEDTQWVKYHHKTGHGFAAEDVNAQIDRWHGRKMVSNAAGIGGGWAGASAGAAIGTVIFPGFETIIGGLIGGTSGGIGASCASRKVTSIFRRKRG